MKKIYFSSLLLAVLGLASCSSDYIDLNPKVGKLESNFYKTEEDAKTSLAAVYDALSWQSDFFVPTNADFRSDDTFVGGDNSGNDWVDFQQTEKFTMSPENKVAENLWKRCYWGIYRANTMLEKTEGITWKTESAKQNAIAEAQFLRAYFYWDLVRHFGSVPIITKVITNPSEISALPQASPDAVFTQIASDLLTSLKNLPDSAGKDVIGHASKLVCKALIGRIYLFHEGYAKTVLKTGVWTDGTTVIDKKYATDALESVITSNKFFLLKNYEDIFSWTNQNNLETIFSFQYNGSSGASDWGNKLVNNGNWSCTWYAPRDPKGDSTIYGGWSFGIPTFSLAAEFENGDIRKEATLYNANVKLFNPKEEEGKQYQYTRGGQNTGYFNKKHMGKSLYRPQKGEVFFNWSLNYIDIRYADVLLMAAELNIGTNQAKSAEYLNKVRNRANLASKNAVTIADIMHERRVELACEGHRYWDLLRQGLSVAETEINKSFTNIPDKPMVNKADFNLRAFNKDTYGLFPIPANDIRLNGGTLIQYAPAYKQ